MLLYKIVPLIYKMVYLYYKMLALFCRKLTVFYKRVVGDSENMVCQTFKMLHLFLCPILLFPSHTLCFHLVPLFSKMVQREAPKMEPKFYLFSSLGTILKGMPYKQD